MPVIERRILRIGVPVEVETVLPSGPVEVHGEIVMVEDDVLTMAVISGKGCGSPTDLVAGTEVSGFAVDHGEVHTFTTEILGCDDNGRELRFALRAPATTTKVERRNYFRLLYQLPVRLRTVDDDGRAHGRYLAESVDLAGGGLAIAMDVSLPAGTRVALRVRLDDPAQAPVEAFGRIVATVRQRGTSEARYRLGIVFDDIAESERERLIQFVFARQRAFRQAAVPVRPGAAPTGSPTPRRR